MGILHQGKKVLCLALLSLAFYSSFDLQSILSRLKEFQTLNNGMGTCFSRVNQSYTAKIMGNSNGSTYLNPTFWNLTEECFGDMIARAEEGLGSSFERVEGKLNALTSEVFWFHGELKGVSGSGLTPKGNKNFKERFLKTEELTGKIYTDMEAADVELMDTLGFKEMAFYFSFFGIFALILWDLMLGRREVGERGKIEKNAEVIKENVGHKRDTKVETIITEALSTSKMPQVSQLFSNYSQKNFDNKFVHGNWKPIKINKSYNVERPSTSLSDIFSKILDLHTAKLFTEGIFLDLNLNDQIHPKVPLETLEQLLFSVFSFGIKNIPQGTQGKKISVKTKQLGDTAILELSNNGPLFKRGFLKGQNGLGQNGVAPEINPRYIDLKVALELCKEFKGEISFENIDDSPVIKIKMKSMLIKESPVKLVSGKHGEIKNELRA
ncbi:MAG: ATP-binding protein [Deltaproteobacteria bacterium]|nr:MAG: ATP-binding protein [Deltaproteobacteria bacterium]